MTQSDTYHFAVDLQYDCLKQQAPPPRPRRVRVHYYSELYPDRYHAFPGGPAYVARKLDELDIPTAWIVTSRRFEPGFYVPIGDDQYQLYNDEKIVVPHLGRRVALGWSGYRPTDPIIVKYGYDAFTYWRDGLGYTSPLRKTLQELGVRRILGSGCFTSACLAETLKSASSSFDVAVMLDKTADTLEGVPRWRHPDLGRYGNPYWHLVRFYESVKEPYRERILCTTSRRLLRHLRKEKAATSPLPPSLALKLAG